jgi:monothiol glutaredoxin
MLRFAANAARMAPRARLEASRTVGARAMHDDFKPQRTDYAEDGDVKAQIEKDISANKVVVFMKGVPERPQCGFSNTVCQVMQVEGVEFKGINVLADPGLREGIKAYSAWPTIPQIYVNGEFIGGCDTTVEMYKSGELRTLLEEVGAK